MRARRGDGRLPEGAQGAAPGTCTSWTPSTPATDAAISAGSAARLKEPPTLRSGTVDRIGDIVRVHHRDGEAAVQGSTGTCPSSHAGTTAEGRSEAERFRRRAAR
jgi:hypothetical protein